MLTKPSEKELMQERGTFQANGYTFTIQPVFLGEEQEYLNDLVLPSIPGKENYDEMTDEELTKWVMELFSKANVAKKKSSRIVLFFQRLFFHRDYRMYKENTLVQPIIKWLEKKVMLNGKYIKFYDLERKYGLLKSEIAQLFIYFHNISFFSNPSHQKVKKN